MGDVNIGDGGFVVVEVGSRCGLEIKVVKNHAEDGFHLHIGEDFARAILLTIREGQVDASIENDIVFANGFSGRQDVRLL